MTTDDTDLEHFPEPMRSGRLTVSNKDLENLSLRIDNKLDRLFSALEHLQKQMEAARHAAETAAQEIQTLRDRSHEHGNKLQEVVLRTSPLTLDMSRELAALLPFMRKGAEFWERHQPAGMLSEDEQKGVRDVLRERAALVQRAEHRAIDRPSHLAQWMLAAFAGITLFVVYVLPHLPH